MELLRGLEVPGLLRFTSSAGCQLPLLKAEAELLGSTQRLKSSSVLAMTYFFLGIIIYGTAKKETTLELLASI